MAKQARELIPAFAYLRTSSAANVGADKFSERRQREAVQSFARRAGYEIVHEFYDAAVSGADAIDARAGFAAMLKRIEGNGVRTIIVETASRFARDLMVQEVGYAMLKSRNIELIAADSPQSFIDDTPTARLVRQVLGAIAEFDEAMTVAKRRGARERKRATGVKVEGRKSHTELRPEVVAEARRLRRKRPNACRPPHNTPDQSIRGTPNTGSSRIPVPFSPRARSTASTQIPNFERVAQGTGARAPRRVQPLLLRSQEEPGMFDFFNPRLRPSVLETHRYDTPSN
jgi:DNA invertase Pin-like site-specific DNA recombinase